MNTYNLDGIPSDIFTSTKEHKRRIKVDNTSIGEQRPLLFHKGDLTIIEGEIVLVSKINLSFSAIVIVTTSIKVNDDVVFTFDTLSELLNIASSFEFINSTYYVKIDLDKIGQYVRLVDGDILSIDNVAIDMQLQGYYEITPFEYYENFLTSNDETFITDGENFLVINNNPYDEEN